MPKFQRIPDPPEYVDAVQWFKAGDHPAVEVFMDGDRLRGRLTTPYGPAFIDPGDWVVTEEGYFGPRHFPCDADKFNDEFVPVDTE